MKTQFTIAHLDDLKAKGFIRGYSPLNPPPEKAVKGKKKGQLPAKGSKIKGWISLQLFAWCKAEGLTLVSELKFSKDRKWRADWAIFHGVNEVQARAHQYTESNMVCLIEYEGLMNEKSRHTTIGGFSKDTEKYREASMLGWTVLRYTALNHKAIVSDLDKIKKPIH